MKSRCLPLKYFFSQDFIKKIILIIIIFSISGAFIYKWDANQSSAANNIFYGIISFSYNYYCNVIIYFLIILYSTIYIYKYIGKNNLILLRKVNYKDYLVFIIRNVIKFNSLVFLMTIFIIFITFYIFFSKNIIFSYTNFLKTNYIVYIIFMFIKIYIIMITMSVIDILSLEIISSKYIYLMNGIFCLSGFFVNKNDIVDSLSKIRILPYSYLTLIHYSSFYLELILTTIYILFMFIILGLLYEFVLKKKIERDLI